MQPEGAVKVDVVKRKVIALWLHFFLNRIGSKHPEFLSDLLNDLNISERHKIIIKSRYVDKLIKLLALSAVSALYKKPAGFIHTKTARRY